MNETSTGVAQFATFDKPFNSCKPFFRFSAMVVLGFYCLFYNKCRAPNIRKMQTLILHSSEFVSKCQSLL